MATKRWIGNALAVAQVDTLTVGGTIEADDKFLITINGKDLSVTAGSTSAATVAANIVAAFNAFDEPEFQELAAAVTSGGSFTLTADTPGVPFTAAVSTTEANGASADAQTFGLSNTVPNTGPWNWDNADNWDAGAVPADSDDVVFDSGSVPCKYGLSQSSVSLASLASKQGWTGTLGLPEYNADGAAAYREYRTQYLTIGDSGDGLNTAITIGQGEGAGSGRIKINHGASRMTVNVLNSGQQADTGVPAVLLKGTHASNEINVLKGTVGLAFYAGETATVSTLRVGFQTNPAGDADVRCGAGCTITNIDQSGGTLEHASATTTNDMTDGTQIIRAGAQTAINVDGGELRYESTATITTLKVGSDGIADFTRDMRSRTVTNAELYDRGTIKDSFRTVTWTNGVDLVRTALDKITLDLGTHLTLTPSSI